jgi:hypothetical protein
MVTILLYEKKTWLVSVLGSPRPFQEASCLFVDVLRERIPNTFGEFDRFNEYYWCN